MYSHHNDVGCWWHQKTNSTLQCQCYLQHNILTNYIELYQVAVLYVEKHMKKMCFYNSKVNSFIVPIKKTMVYIQYVIPVTFKSSKWWTSCSSCEIVLTATLKMPAFHHISPNAFFIYHIHLIFSPIIVDHVMCSMPAQSADQLSKWTLFGMVIENLSLCEYSGGSKLKVLLLGQERSWS